MGRLPKPSHDAGYRICLGGRDELGQRRFEKSRGEGEEREEDAKGALAVGPSSFGTVFTHAVPYDVHIPIARYRLLAYESAVTFMFTAPPKKFVDAVEKRLTAWDSGIIDIDTGESVIAKWKPASPVPMKNLPVSTPSPGLEAHDISEYYEKQRETRHKEGALHAWKKDWGRKHLVDPLRIPSDPFGDSSPPSKREPAS